MERVPLSLSELTLEQKFDVLEQLWKSLLQDEESIKSPGWHEDVLREREAAFKAGRIKLSDWEDAKKRIYGKVSCR